MTNVGACSYWNDLYQQQRYVYGTRPNEYVVEQAFRLNPGMKALEIAGGEGRNAVWLASHRLDVLSIDFSETAIQKTEQLAQQAGVYVRTACANILDWAWPESTFDIVVSTYLHLLGSERMLIHKQVTSCLKPGGIVIIEAFHKKNARYAGTSADVLANFLYTIHELRQDFEELDILEALERTVCLDEGHMHQGMADIVRFLGRKPLSQ